MRDSQTWSAIYVCSSYALFLSYWFDQVDGYLARKFKMQSVMGTILDPAADKILMTTLTVTLAMKDLISGA